ncbi:hypothetical protein KY343_06280 [Candidatus Woesearchaeota archaeon]|nr:hypothetical protein [Candidatus Woesearchaeota archaeon]
MEILNQIGEWIMNHPYILSFGLMSISIAGAGILLYKEGKECDRKREEEVRKINHARAVFDCGEFSEKEALAGKLYMGKYFGYELPDELYRKIAKEMGINEERISRIEEMVKSYDKKI